MAISADSAGHHDGGGIFRDRTVNHRHVVLTEVSQENGLREDAGPAEFGDVGTDPFWRPDCPERDWRIDPVVGPADGKPMAAGAGFWCAGDCRHRRILFRSGCAE